MVLVGLTGGLATGKSTVARMFQDCGAMLIDADLLARLVVEPDRPAWREIVRAFGKQILRPDRTLDRAALANIVFRNRTKLRLLGAIIHPRVAREQACLTRELAQKHPHAVVLYDAPVLIEAGAHKRMDRVIVVTADRLTQIARLRHRNHLTRAEALRRIQTQMPLARKVRLADFVVNGTLPPEQLRREVARIYAELRRIA
jgi:dephospho-CoA kinase